MTKVKKNEMRIEQAQVDYVNDYIPMTIKYKKITRAICALPVLAYGNVGVGINKRQIIFMIIITNVIIIVKLLDFSSNRIFLFLK